MSDQAPRKCGVCKLPPREGQEMSVFRLAPEDVAAETDTNGAAIEPGAYMGCIDCLKKYQPRIAARLKTTPRIDGNGKPVVDDAGQPVMTIAHDHQAVGRMLL
ncbi:MAG: hypothetical protein K2R98_08550 [Gemmataceae bacterium]|nr:hypothetical protein [Gemmataceae bacterium]